MAPTIIVLAGPLPCSCSASAATLVASVDGGQDVEAELLRMSDEDRKTFMSRVGLIEATDNRFMGRSVFADLALTIARAGGNVVGARIFTSANGDEKVVELVGPGQSFGEALMFMEAPYVIYAQTLADSLLPRLRAKESGSSPCGKRTTLTLRPSSSIMSMPRSEALMPAGSAA